MQDEKGGREEGFGVLGYGDRITFATLCKALVKNHDQIKVKSNPLLNVSTQA